MLNSKQDSEERQEVSPIVCPLEKLVHSLPRESQGQAIKGKWHRSETQEESMLDRKRLWKVRESGQKARKRLQEAAGDSERQGLGAHQAIHQSADQADQVDEGSSGRRHTRCLVGGACRRRWKGEETKARRKEESEEREEETGHGAEIEGDGEEKSAVEQLGFPNVTELYWQVSWTSCNV